MPAEQRRQPIETRFLFDPFELNVTQRSLKKADHIIPLGGRAFDVLLALVDRAGEVIGKDELIAKAWPDLAVEESSLRVHLSLLRKALGEFGFGRKYIANVRGRGYCFVAPVTRRIADDHKATSFARSPDARPFSNFPARSSYIFGREELLEKLSLPNNRGRLLTITGPGGIGKTTVAVALAERVREVYADGAAYLDLAPLSDPSVLSATIAAHLGVLVRSTDAVEDIIAHLRNRQFLILMDNCEHLVDALSPIISRLLSNLPRIDIVATSREPLLIPEEKVENLDPLELPLEQDDISDLLRAAMSASAIRLFVARARATTPDFCLTKDNVDLVVSICRQLDGLPLAIQLASALLVSLSLKEVQSRLDGHFQTLRLGYRTAPLRHQNLQNLLDWSYGLLSPAERDAFAGLSVFRRSFSLDGAISILQMDEPSAIGILTCLVRKSLVVSNENQTSKSYRLLETTRAFAAKKLIQTAQRDDVARRHAGHIMDLFGACDPIDAASHHQLVTALLDDQRAALEWALSPVGDLRIASKLAIKAVPVLLGMGLEAECRTQFGKTVAKVLGADETFDREKMELYAAGGQIVTDAGRWSKILAFAQKLDDVEFRMRAHYGLFLSYIYGGRVDQALLRAQDMLQDAGKIRHDGCIAMANRMCGLCNQTLGKQKKAMESVAALTSPPVRGENEGKPSASLSFFGLFDDSVIRDVFIARTLLLNGKIGESISISERAAQRSHEIGHLPTVLYAYVHAGCLIPLMLGDVELSRRVVRKFVGSVITVYRNEDQERFQWGPLFSGWLKILEGGIEEGISEIQSGMDALGDGIAKFTPTNTPFYAALAEGQLAIGQYDAALSTLDHALRKAKHGWGGWYDPELLRLRAEALRGLKRPVHEIERAYKHSHRIARVQDAPFWQWKTASGLAGFYKSLGRPSDAKRLIEPLHKRLVSLNGEAWFEPAEHAAQAATRP